MVRKVKKETTEAAKDLRDGNGGGIREAAVPEDQVQGPPETEEGLMARLQEAEKRAAENYDKYVRAVAELENFRKRSAREKTDAIQYGNENLLRDILPLVDSMDRAREHACNSDDFEAFKKGLEMLQEQLMSCLQKHGVAPIDSVGKGFDPNVHEAMLQVASDRHEDSQVVGEFEKGYLLNGRLLRPAKVSVCKRAGKDDEQRQDCE